MLFDDEEKKKREEEAKSIINSNSIGETINSINYANYNNLKIETRNENEQTFINKVNEANNIINSINPRQNVEAPSASEEDKMKSQQNAQKFIDLMDKNNSQSSSEKIVNTEQNGIQIEDKIDNKDRSVDTIQESTLKKQNPISLEEKKQNFESYINAKKSSMQTVSNTIQENVRKQELIKKNVEERNKTLIEQANETFRKQYPSTVTKNNLQTVIPQKDEMQIALSTETQNLKVAKSGDLFKLTDGKVDDRKQAQKIVDSAFGIGENVLMGIESVIPSTVSYVNEGGKRATAKAGSYLAKQLLDVDDKTAELFGEQVFNKLWEFTEFDKTNKELNSEALKKWRRETIAKNVNKTYYGEKIAEIAPSVGQNIVPMVVSYFNPPAGTALFMTSAAGSYLEDAEERGMNKDQAFTYATVMGIFEGATEEVISGKMLSNSMKIFGGVGLSEEVLNSFGVSTVENFFQEAIIEPLQETTATIIGGKDKANWDNIWQRSMEAGVDGILSSILLNGASVGIASASNIVNKKNPTKTEIQTALSDTINSKKVDINSIVNGAKEAIKENKYYINTEKFFINETSNNESTNIRETNGIKVELLNDKLNIIPAVVKNDNSFIVIDAETGIKLDTTNYTSQTEAIKGFNDKIRNLDNVSIDNINNKITEGKLSLINQIVNNTNNDQNVNGITSTNNSSYMQNKGERYTKKQFDDITKAIDQISNKAIYNNGATINTLRMVSNNIENINLIEQSGNYYINALDSDGNISYQQKIVNRPYTGKRIKEIVNNAIQYADTSFDTESANTNIAQTSSNQNADSLQSQETSYTPQDIQRITEPFSLQEDYTKNEMAKVWNNEIAQNEYDISYDENGNIKNYIAIEEDGDNLVVSLYDNEDNIIKSEPILSDNGKYISNDITSAIEKVSSLYDENRPIKGQQNIEGNEVRSMKKEKDSDKIILKSIQKFNEAKKEVNRQDIINVANALNVFHKNNQTFVDKNMSTLAGNNKMSKINAITEFFKNYKNKTELRKMAGTYALEEYKNETIIIKDTKTKVDLSQKGLKKTFNIKQSNETLQTAPILPKIIKESVYVNSSIDLEDNNFVYHYFYSPISVNGSNAISMITIKEIVTDKSKNPKFYYHDIREINNEELLHAIPQQKLSKMLFEETPSIDNSIPQKTKVVKSDKNTAINKSTQESKKNTIHYDNQGRKLTIKQAEYFKDSKVRDEKGNLLVVYHGTNNAGFTKFKRNVNYFSDNKEVAQTYTGNEGIYEGYINIENPIVIDANKEIWSKIDIANISIDAIGDIESFLNENGASTWKEGGKIRTSTADLVSAISDAIDDNVLKADGIIIKNIYDEGEYSGSIGKKLGTDYITFKSNQFKNNTNIKPTVDDDIRYMKKSNTTLTNAQKENTLIAQHNTSEEKLLEALDIGALPVPSIAITKYQNPVSNYGEITLLFNKDTINPTDKRNVTYNSDIYSTRKPQTANMLDKQKVKSFEKVATDNGISYGYLNMIEEYIENNDLIKARDIIKYELQKANSDITDQEIENVYTEALKCIQEKRIMKPGVDPYTASGNRKTIQQMSIPYTLDNIVQIMTKKNTKGSESNSFSGLAEIRANLSQKFKSIEAMHSSENNLISSHEMENLKNELNDTFYNLLDEIGKYDNIDRYFGSGDVIANAINETAKSKNITIDVLDNELDYVSIKNVPKDVLQKTVDFLNNLKNVPTEYFESKPQRAVGFNEVKKAIVPKNISKEVLDKLIEKGIDIEYYNTQDERMKKISNNEDIRFAKRTAKSQNKNIDKTQRNAEREGNYIEQEIQKIEATGQWDNSIPVTKLTDIRKTIEDYLGLRIKKGHFRQAAYAIYKGNRDVIRTQEFKDIDSILHETGHALDIGNRLKIDKESIANELLTAIDRLGGYENETREIRLEEGFAEVIREYSIIPEQAKAEYPQAVSIIESMRKADKSFDTFISKVQKQAYNYIHQNPRNRTLSNVSIGEQTDKAPLTKNWLRQEIMRNIYDKDWVVKSVVNEMQKANGKTINQLKASNNAYFLTRLATGIGDKVTSMLSDGYIDEYGNKLMPGLNQIGEILGNDPKRFDDLRAYLVARRDTDYKSKTLKTGIRSMDSKTVIEQFKNDTQIQEASKLIYDTLDGVMQYAVSNGLITQETADNLKESNAFYVPMQRVLENKGNQVGRRGAVADVIKKRTGSELDIKDILENVISNSSNMIQQVENNNILRALYKQGEESGITGAIYDVIDAPMIKVGTANLETWKTELERQGVNTSNLNLEKTIDLFAPNNKVDRQNLITSFIDENGKRVYLQFNDELIFNSVMNMDKKFMSQVLNLTSKLNMPLRYGATMANIGFAIPNMISDTAQAAIYSTAGFIPVVDNALGVLDVLAANNKTVSNFLNKVAPEYAKRINNLYTIYNQTGSTSSTRLSQYRKSTQSIMKDIYGTKKSETLGIKESFKPLKRLLDLMTYIPELSEQSTRFEVFKKNYDYYNKKGYSEMDTRIMAALEARDATQDFGRTGNITKEINQLVPFSAARVGSSYTFAEKIKANPKQVGMRIAILMALGMAIKGLGYDDKEIEELNQRKKDDNFVFKIGDKIITIKKPQGILRSMLNLTEYIQDLATGHIEEGKEGERLNDWLHNAIWDNMPADSIESAFSSMPGGPLLENAINKDLYYNTEIVKSYDLELPNSEQYYDYNSQLAIFLGKAFNRSPAKIDNLISGFFGGLGTQVTNMIDTTLGKLGITAQKPEMGAESNAVGKRFVVNVNTNSASIDEIYNKKTELTKKKNGGDITEKETAELESITEAISNMSKVNKQIKEIKKDLSMSGKEKANQIKLLQQQRTDIARQALGKDLLYNTNASKIQSITFYPSSSTLKKSGYSLELTTAQKEEYEQIASDYYNKNKSLYNKEKLDDLKSKAKDYAKNQLMQKYKNNLAKTKK